MMTFSESRPALALYAVQLRTARWKEMLDWYRQRLGLRTLVRVDEDGYAQLAVGSGRLVLLHRPRESLGGPSPRCELVFETDDLPYVVQRLTAIGEPFEQHPRHQEGFVELTLRDPDGNRVRIFSWPLPPDDSYT